MLSPLLNTSLSTPVIALVVSFSISFAAWAILSLLLKTGWAWHIAVDTPNARSMHIEPTPRVGGWGIIPLAVMIMLIFMPSLRVVAVCALVLAVISYCDDRWNLAASKRFVAHALTVVMFLFFYGWSLPAYLFILIVIALIWMINLYNFMDGLDGLAGGMAVLGFAAYAWTAWPTLPELSWACLVIASAAMGFLWLNLHPAKLFMGDLGSVPLGFFAGALGFYGWQHQAWPAWFPVLVFLPFIADASLTLLKRLMRKERFWQAHRNHYYQRLARMGWGHRRVAWLWYALMLTSAVLAIYLQHRSSHEQLIGIAIWLTLLALLAVLIDLRWARFANKD